MARKPSPWYWPERNGWYTILHGKRQHLADHPADAPPPKKRGGKWIVPPAIDQAFHVLLAMPDPQPPRLAAAPCDSPLVSVLLDKYLDWCRRENAVRTFEWYRDHIQHFLDSLPDASTLAVNDLKPLHVIEWVGKHPNWSATYRRGAIGAIQRAFNWAEELGYVAANPIKKIKKPRPERRENPMSRQDFDTLLAMVKEGDPFRDLLLFAWNSGCRPQEARHIEPRHVQLPAECIVVPKDEAKGKRRARVIHLHGAALEIVTRLMQDRTEGKLFLNSKGRPWKKYALCNRFDRLQLAIGKQRMKVAGISIPKLPRFNRHRFSDKATMLAARREHQQRLSERRKALVKLARQHGRGHCAYDLRHGFCQRLLENGANHLAVAELMGHASGRMVAETYSHMNQATAHLKETLKKASASNAGA